jgi:hypothetical protein
LTGVDGMKRVLVLAALVLGGCTTVSGYSELAPMVAPPQPVPVQALQADGAPIERIPFRAGVSSATVEKLAKQHACSGGQGAGLMTEPGPVEVYKMQCEDGKVFMARCELRQCRQM